MKIEKLPSGSYRVQKQINGKRYSFTFDHSPTKKEINAIIFEKTNSTVTLNNAPRRTFEDCAKKYLSVKENVLSASTMRSYNTILRNLDEEFKNTLLTDIDQLILQQLINDLSGQNKTPKTIRNYHAFIIAVLNMFIPDVTYKVTLPKPIKTESYIPTSEDVKAVLSASNDLYYIIFMLGCYGLRRSEILALTMEDIDADNCTVSINKSMVQGADNKWVVQNFNKTTESTRVVPVSEDLIQRIFNQGYIFNGHPDKIYEYLIRKQKQLGLPHFKFHSLRHYFATELDQAGFSSKDIQKLGGWSSDHILKTVYQHNRVDRDKAIQKKAVNLISDNLT